MKTFLSQIKGPQGEYYKLDDTRLLIDTKETKADILGILKKFGFEVESGGSHQKNLQAVFEVNNTDSRVFVHSLLKKIDDKRLDDFFETLKESANWIGPVYKHPKSIELKDSIAPIPQGLIFKTRSGDIEKEKNLAETLGLEYDEGKSKYLYGFRYYKLKDPANQDVFELIRHIDEKEYIVLYEIMPLVKPTAFIPGSPLYPEQWNLETIKAPGAWDITKGRENVVICILDEGCDLDHPSLTFSDDGINLGTMQTSGSPTGPHGTACAGIAAAKISDIGIAGVAGNCKILPLAINDWTDVQVAAGINYAVDKKVDVINMSFGWDGWNHEIIDSAIQSAFDNNIVMCACTHNDNGAIRYPATNPLVIAVGATSTDDNRKTPLSPDREKWGSNYGDVVVDNKVTGVSVVAPGIRCPTTDILGNGGYYTGSGSMDWKGIRYNNVGTPDGNYFFIFNGTSAATAHVSGLAALLKSRDQGLSNANIRNIIEKSADKVGSFPYTDIPGFPNGSRNQFMGYGRINLFNALNFGNINTSTETEETEKQDKN
jgi:subtilisin family serine protease